MRSRSVFICFLAILSISSAALAASLSGSVFLMPVDSMFRSVGRADYYNDLNQQEAATMSGEHRVNRTNGALTFQAAVTGNYSYFYILEGPASPGDCFTTSLHVIARPAVPPISGATQFEGSWNGPETKCAPADPPPPPIDQCDPATNTCSPIVFNLANGSYQLTGANDPVLFDISASGTPRRIGWTATGADEAFLWLDRNHNGRVDDGSELFGNATRLQSGQPAPNGFIAPWPNSIPMGMASLMPNDPIWNSLLLWVDRNHDHGD